MSELVLKDPLAMRAKEAADKLIKEQEAILVAMKTAEAPKELERND